MARRYAAALVSLALVGAVALAGCSGSGAKAASSPTPSATTSAGAGPAELTFAVYGSPAVVAAYSKIAADFTAKHPDIVVNVKHYATHAAAAAALATEEQGGQVPDIFLADSGDVPGLVAGDVIRNVDDLLGDRGIDFGDSYQRSALEVFSADAGLQCMPVDYSPMVLYVNTDLLDVTQLGEAKPHDPAKAFSMTEWAEAAQLATGHGHRGVYVAPTLQSLAPFVWSAGGSLVDEKNPTGLTLADSSSQKGVEQLLEVARNPTTTYTQAQIAKRSALKRFENGGLAMMFGFRDLVPVLRAKRGLHFDVMPIPRVGAKATVAQSDGACLAKNGAHVKEAADFLAYLVSDGAADILAETGAVMPTNVDAVNDDAFLQPGQQPEHAQVFATAVRGSQVMPALAKWPDVVAATQSALTALFYDPVIDPVQDRLTKIDDLSTTVLSPSPSASPSTSAGSSPSASPSSP